MPNRPSRRLAAGLLALVLLALPALSAAAAPVDTHGVSLLAQLFGWLGWAQPHQRTVSTDQTLPNIDPNGVGGLSLRTGETLPNIDPDGIVTAEPTDPSFTQTQGGGGETLPDLDPDG